MPSCHLLFVGVGAWLGVVDGFLVGGSISGDLGAIGHTKFRHSVEDLARDLHFYSLRVQASASHVSTDDHLVSVDGVLHHAALAES